MRYAIPITDGRVSDHFGHCESFALIDANLPHRPIYLTDSDEVILTRYLHTQVGTLYKLGMKG